MRCVNEEYGGVAAFGRWEQLDMMCVRHQQRDATIRLHNGRCQASERFVPINGRNAGKRRLAFALATLCLSGTPLLATASAQQIPIVQSGADGRYERQIDPKTSIPGFDASVARSFRAAVDELVAQLGAMPSVTSPPAPVCHRLMTYIEITPPHGVPAASVSVLSPINFNNGRCSPVTGGGIEFILNRTSAAFERSRADVPEAEGGRASWFVLNPAITDNVIRLRDGTTLITNGGALLTPVSARRYAMEKIKQSGEADGHMPPPASRRPSWTVQLSRLGAGEAERQACVDEWGALDTAADCPAYRKVWEVNPDYFDTTRPGKVQLMVLRTPQGPYHGESAERFKARQAMWASIDVARLSALVTR